MVVDALRVAHEARNVDVVLRKIDVMFPDGGVGTTVHSVTETFHVMGVLGFGMRKVVAYVNWLLEELRRGALWTRRGVGMGPAAEQGTLESGGG